MKYQRRPHIEDRGVPEFQWPAEGEKKGRFVSVGLAHSVAPEERQEEAEERAECL